MIPYLDRDLIRTFFLAFVTLIGFVIVGVFIKSLLELFQFLDGNKLIPFILMFVYSIPRQLVYAIPVATSVAILWAFTVKARNNELLACLVGGLSPFRIARPIFIVALILSGVNFTITEFLATKGDQEALRLERVEILGGEEGSVTRERNVFQKGQGERFYYIPVFLPSQQRMEQPLVVHLQDGWSGPRWRLDAEYAQEIVENGVSHWAFFDFVYREYNEEGELLTYREDDRILDTELNPPLEQELDRYVKQRFKPEQMSTAELLEYISLFKMQHRDSSRLETILHFNIALPIGTFVLAMVMCGHILRPRSSGVVIGLGGGMIFIGLFFVMLIFGRKFSVEGFISPIIGAYVPNVIFLIIGLVLMKRNRAAD